MNVTLLVITDGRGDCLTETLASAEANLPEFTRRLIVDDSASPDYRDWLDGRYRHTFEIVHHRFKQGFAGSIRTGWVHVARSSADYVYHLEDDWTHNRPVPLQRMAAVLARRPELVQLALRRQPWNDEERAAGGVVETHPDDFTDIEDGDDRWLQHRRFFTTNPSLYRATLCELDWPDTPHSEGIFTHQLLRDDPSARFGYWGARDSGEWVTHIGNIRVGSGY